MKQYIDKAVIKAEIDKRIMDAPINHIGHQRVWAYNDVKDILNTLEVKETETIDKNKLLEELKELKQNLSVSPIVVIEDVESLVESLEVKEVDLDNEYVEEVYSHLDSIKDTADRMTSGEFMHNKGAIKVSANTIVEVLVLMGSKAKKG